MEYILGTVVSLIVQVLKKKGGLNTIGSMLALLVISLIGGGAYVYLKNTGSWQIIVAVLVNAAAFHELILRRFNS